MPYKASQKLGGIVIYDARRIARHYVTGWFGFDLLTSVPFDLIVGLIVGWKNEGSTQLIQLLRAFRMVKLLRIVRATRIIRRWQDHIAVSFAMVSLIKFSLLTCMLAHWLACLWGECNRLITSALTFCPHADYSPPSGSRFPPRRRLFSPLVSLHCPGFIAISSDEIWTGYDDGLSWRQKARVASATAYELYGVSLYVALNTIFGGSCEIQAGNYYEFFVQGFMLLAGSSVWAYVIGSACGIVAVLYGRRTHDLLTMLQHLLMSRV